MEVTLHGEGYIYIYIIYIILSICNIHVIHVCMNKDIKAVNLIEIKECAWEGLKEKR